MKRVGFSLLAVALLVAMAACGPRDKPGSDHGLGAWISIVDEEWQSAGKPTDTTPNYDLNEQCALHVNITVRDKSAGEVGAGAYGAHGGGSYGCHFEDPSIDLTVAHYPSRAGITRDALTGSGVAHYTVAGKDIAVRRHPYPNDRSEDTAQFADTALRAMVTMTVETKPDIKGAWSERDTATLLADAVSA